MKRTFAELQSRLPGVRIRRSRCTDAGELADLCKQSLLSSDGIPAKSVFQTFTVHDFMTMIETSAITLTATIKLTVSKDEAQESSRMQNEINTTKSSNINNKLEHPLHHENETEKEEQSEKVIIVGFVALGVQYNSEILSNYVNAESEGNNVNNNQICNNTHDLQPYNTLRLNMLLAPTSETIMEKYYEEQQQEQQELKMKGSSISAEEKLNNVNAASNKNEKYSGDIINAMLPGVNENDSSSINQNTFDEQLKQSKTRRRSAMKPMYTSIELARELVRLALGIAPRIQHIYCVIPCKPGFLLLDDIKSACKVITRYASPTVHEAAEEQEKEEEAVVMSYDSAKLYILHRASFITPLHLRRGRIEDYDDFVPLLLHGSGVITNMPNEFYLDEILQNQDEVHKVVVAEDAHTHRVVALACLRLLTRESEQRLTRAYNTEVKMAKMAPLQFDQRVKHTQLEAAKAAKRTGHTFANTFAIEFLYFNPYYNTNAQEFVPFMFDQFEMCEFAALYLPHDISECPLLQSFEYTHLRSYDPFIGAFHNNDGGSGSNIHDKNNKNNMNSVNNTQIAPVPLGLWLCCRYVYNRFSVNVMDGKGNETTKHDLVKLMEKAEETVSEAKIKKIMLDVAAAESAHTSSKKFVTSQGDSVTVPEPEMNSSQVSAFRLFWENSQLIGIATVQNISVADLYALRANYNLDAFIYFYAQQGKDYSATDITISEVEGKTKFYTRDMPAMLIRTMFVLPQFHLSIRFYLHEMLRLCDRQMALVIADERHLPFAPLQYNMVPAEPRRVQEKMNLMENNATRDLYTHTSNSNMKKESDKSYNCKHQTREQLQKINQQNTNALRRVRCSERASLFYATLRTIGDAKMRINTRIVIVGASSTGLAALHRLLSVPYVLFTNLVLISTDGLPRHDNELSSLWHADVMTLREREHARLVMESGTMCGSNNPTTTNNNDEKEHETCDTINANNNAEDGYWGSSSSSTGNVDVLFGASCHQVRVITGTVVDLDKLHQFVVIDNGTCEPYDYLLLTSGRQYTIPRSLHTLLMQERQSERTIKHSIIALTDELALERIKHKISAMDRNPNNVSSVMVYGSSLDALAIVTAIIQMGFSPQRLILCSRHYEMEMVPESYYEVITSVLKAMGVNVLRGYDVVRMEFDEGDDKQNEMANQTTNDRNRTQPNMKNSDMENNNNNNNSNETQLTTVVCGPVHERVSPGCGIELACNLIITIEEKDIDANILAMLNKQSIVFDGRVIIDANYRTTNCKICAAGPVAMFTRRYGTNSDLDVYNARDVGFHVGEVLMANCGLGEFKNKRYCEANADGAKLFAQNKHKDRAAMVEDKQHNARDCYVKEDDNDYYNNNEDEEDDDYNSDGDFDGDYNSKANDTNMLYWKVLEENGSCWAQDQIYNEMLAREMSGKKETSVLERKRLLPKYNSPRARRVRLPCGLTYFCTFCVNFKLEHCVALDCKDFDVNELTELTDYTLPDNASAEVKREHSFFTIYVNTRTRMIDGVVYLGNGKPEVHNYCALVGLPESLINLMYRYNETLEEAKHDTKAADNNYDETDTLHYTEQEQRQQETSKCTKTLTRTSTSESSSESSLTGAGLTARTVHGKLDLIEYLRLPHLQTIYYDRFSTFFTYLHGKMQQHVEAMRVREQILTTHRMDTFLSKEDSDKYKAMLTNAQSNFNYQVQLELLKFLHDNKDFLPQNMYLPDVTPHLKAAKQKS